MPLTEDSRRFFIKREDLNGVGFGGNKIRRMEYLLGEALAEGCDCLIVGGGSRSNQTIAAAACAAKVGMQVHMVVPESTGSVTRGLAELLGAALHYAMDGQTTSLNKEIRSVETKLKNDGHHPYVIKPGAEATLGILGYVDCMQELYEQAEKKHIHVDHVVCCGGTGITYAGVLLGTKLYSPDTRATAVSIGRRFKHAETLVKQVKDAAIFGGYSVDVDLSDVHVYFSCGKGAAEPTTKGRDAMKLMASKSGIFLDPLFTGKAFAGLLDMSREGYFKPGETIVFIHTGGMITLLGGLS